MLRCEPARAGNSIRCVTGLIITLFVFPLSLAVAGNNFFRNNGVGGVSIDASGVVRQPDVAIRAKLVERMRKDVAPAAEEMTNATSLRMVSLRGLEAAIREHGLKDVPEDLRFLAGMQRVQYVFVYPEINDIVLAGPGEGWRALGEDDFENVNCHDDTWTWKDGTAHCTGKPVGVIASQ